MGYDGIEVVIHPQSIIHSMVEITDDAVLAQLGFPTMELPILYALTYPERIIDQGTRFDAVRAGTLTFESLDEERFPAFVLGVESGREGGTAPAVFNAANEVAVAAFLAGDLPFLGIAEATERVLAAHLPQEIDTVGNAIKADKRERAEAQRNITERY